MGVKKAKQSITRREVLSLAAVGAMAACAAKVSAQLSASAPASADPELDKLIAGLKPTYLTPTYSSGDGFKPHLAERSPEQLRDIGLDPATWQLEVLPAEKTKAQVNNPLSKSAGTAFTYAALMKMAETKAVRFMSGRICMVGGGPTAVGMWEGVPLREIIALAKPGDNIRRVVFHGYMPPDSKGTGHTSTLSLDRVMEDPPGYMPVILAYKYNGNFLTVKNGGPVRMITAEDYNHRQIKWLWRVFLTDSFKAADTYAGGPGGGNDTGCSLQNRAYVRDIRGGNSGKPRAIIGEAQVGAGGVSKVQYAICPEAQAPAADDQFMTQLDWRDGTILPPPTDWGGGFPGGKLPPAPLQFDQAGVPLYWPLRFNVCWWAALVRGVQPGKYNVYCRTVDLAGNAQPMPRPFVNAAHCEIDKHAVVTVKA